MSVDAGVIVAERSDTAGGRGRPSPRRTRSHTIMVELAKGRETSVRERHIAERERLLAPLLDQVDTLAARALAAMRADLPAYADRGVSFREDVLGQIRRNYAAVLRALIDGRLPTTEELAFQRAASMRRVRAGFALADYLSAYRVAQHVLWDAIVQFAEEAGIDQRLVLELAAEFMRSMDFATTHAGETYGEFRAHGLAAGERRALLDQLLRGVLPQKGPLAAAADRYGLGGVGTPALVGIAVPLAAGSDRDTLELARASFARAGLQEPSALVVIRQHELVAVLSLAAHAEPDQLCAGLERAQVRLRHEGAPVAIGVSTIARGASELPTAYREAVSAVRFVGKEGGVVALTRLSLTRYLALGADETAHRLIDPRITTFLADDARRGGMLVATLRAYAETDLSLKNAAARLHVHANTMQYRLARVEEATGLSPRRFEHLCALLLAIEVNEPWTGGGSGAARPDAG